MDDSGRQFRETVRTRYNKLATIWDRSDNWHKKVWNEIEEAVARLQIMHPDPYELVVDVGSGGLSRNVTCRNYLQLDIAETRLTGNKLAVCSDAHALPLKSGSADCILCLGSVANYCSLIELAQEFGRVCSPGGSLLFHIELSNSMEYLATPDFAATAALVTTHYQGSAERTWVYSHGNVKRALQNAGFNLLESRYFHVASALGYRLGLSPNRATTLSILDPLLSRLPGIGNISDSVIWTCRR